MKLLIIVITFLLIASVGIAGEMHGSVELGQDVKWSLTFVDVQLNYSFDIWIFDTSIFGGVITYFETEYFIPRIMRRSIFPLGLQINYQDFFIRGKWFCSHPTINHNYTDNGDLLDRYLWNMSGIIISAGIEF